MCSVAIRTASCERASWSRGLQPRSRTLREGPGPTPSMTGIRLSGFSRERAVALPGVRGREPSAGAPARHGRAWAARPLGRGPARPRWAARGDRRHRSSLRLPSLRRNRRRAAARRCSRPPLLALGDRGRARVVGLGPHPSRLGPRAHEHREDDRRGLGGALGLARALDSMRPGALRVRAARPRRGPRAGRARRRFRRLARTGLERARAHARLLRSFVLTATLSDVDESACTPRWRPPEPAPPHRGELSERSAPPRAPRASER